MWCGARWRVTSTRCVCVHVRMQCLAGVYGYRDSMGTCSSSGLGAVME